MINSFESFNIRTVPRKQNQVADALAVAASTLKPLQNTKLQRFTIEIVPTPSIPDNVTNFQVFNDDQQMLEFMVNQGVFACQEIGEDQVESNDKESENIKDGVIQLKTNKMPRGIASLERMFDPDMIHDERVTNRINAELAYEINIGTPTDKKNILIGKSCVSQERKIIDVINQHIHIIAWKYEHLKTYNPEIITHTIPLKLGVAPFRLRQRQVNALLQPIIF